MKIVYVHADAPNEWNSSEWRCAVPARAINRSGRHSAEMINMEDFARGAPPALHILAAADVIVVQRNLFGPALAAIQHWKARDKAVIADFDDAFNLIHSSNANYTFWSQGIVRQPDGSQRRIDPPPLTQFKWGLRLVHAATAPSRRLVDDWQPFAEMHYLPNYIDLRPYENAAPEEHEGIILGWGGSLSHLQSFTGSGVAAALKRVCRARPQVKVMVCGNDRRVWEMLPLPVEQKIFQPWTAYSEWGRTLANFDIGLAPLHGPFDDRRSWIKVLEYMVMKIPWVASDSPAYEDLRSYGWLVQNTASAWERVLMDMIDHLEDYRQEAAGAPYLYAISQSVDENVENILAVYADVYQRVVGNGGQESADRLGYSLSYP
ncbi:MAG: glycosyltransferase [Chloroflexi bacterium]|nr:glycosyltransferase [Chloroflexota bacterium]